MNEIETLISVWEQTASDLVKNNVNIATRYKLIENENNELRKILEEERYQNSSFRERFQALSDEKNELENLYRQAQENLKQLDALKKKASLIDQKDNEILELRKKLKA